MKERLSISDKEYFALPYCSSSGMKEAEKLFKAGKGNQFDPTKAYAFGSAFDALLTNLDEYETSNLEDKDINLLLPMRAALMNNAIYRGLFIGDHVDSQSVWIDKEFKVNIEGLITTIPAKCKYDAWNNQQRFGGDIKSTASKSQSQFEAAAKHFKYHLQGAWYMDITNSDRFIILGVSKTLRPDVFIIQIKRGSPAYEAGKKAYEYYLPYWWKLYGITANKK